MTPSRRHPSVSTTVAPPDAGILAWYDALTEDPPGHRLEVLEGALVVAPSPSKEHQDRARGLAEVIDEALADRELLVVEDVEWPLEQPDTRLGSRPRPDVCVVDSADADGPRLLTAEVISASDHERVVPGVAETRIEAKRRVYAYGGTQVHLEVEQVEGIVEVRAYQLRGGILAAAASARGAQTLSLSEPFALEIVPDRLAGWLRRRLEELAGAREAEATRADTEASRADAAAMRAATEATRADTEASRADAAEARAIAAEALLRRRDDEG